MNIEETKKLAQRTEIAYWYLNELKRIAVKYPHKGSILKIRANLLKKKHPELWLDIKRVKQADKEIDKLLR